MRARHKPRSLAAVRGDQADLPDNTPLCGS
jgi:hypothetical protein